MNRSITRAAVVGLVFVGSLLGSWVLTRPSERTSLPNPGRGSELAIVLLVSPTCPACRNPDLPAYWSAVVQHAAAHVSPTVPNISTIGIAISGNPEAGVDFLRQFGRFHEFAVGRGSLNVGALRYVVNDFRGPVAVPQVIFVRREFHERRDGSVYLRAEKVVQRLTGLDDIAVAARTFPRGLFE